MSLSEADTRSKLIDPALYQRGWTEDHIKREETAGAIIIDPASGQARRASKGRIDYTLRLKITADSQPVAIALIEAKAEDKPASLGLEQCKKYADLLHVPFVYSSNGYQYFEYDHTTGLTAGPISLDLFPRPEELQKRYEQAKGFTLDSPAARPLLTRYARGEATRRYYQDAAIRAVFEKLACCEVQEKPRRALLSLATGSGKTFIAVQLLKRIAEAYSDRPFRALFICDRDELRIQAAAAFQNEFGSNAAVVSGTNPQKNAKLLIATYQTLDIDGPGGEGSEESTANFLTTHYPENYFTHIVIDECHRSAWGKWSQVFHRNPSAVQIGLTATPRQFESHCPETPAAKLDAQITADNIAHFGTPVYEYDMVQGMADGYLAACVVQKGRVNIDDTGITIEDLLARHAADARTGQILTRDQLKDIYDRTEFEQRIQLPDRVLAMCADLFDYLLTSGTPYQKTIIFCASDYHADAVAIAMNNLYATWYAAQSGAPAAERTTPLQSRAHPYAFKCTASVGGADYIADFKGASRSHFIATTVDLLSTGVDVPPLKNVVFFRYLASPITFYQMVGRGTRLDPATGKLMFTLYDYTGVTNLFGREFITEPPRPKSAPSGPPSPPQPTILVQGFDVQITPVGRLILSKKDGKDTLITLEEYKQQLAAELVALAPTLDNFRSKWIVPKDRKELLIHLPEAGRSLLLIQSLSDMFDYDGFDILADLAYGLAPRTRPDRAGAFLYKHAPWLSHMPTPAACTVKALASQFALAGTDALENPHIFQTPQVQAAGGLPALQQLGDPKAILRDTKRRMFTA
jgi:type I restriction enzyme R subunit